MKINEDKFIDELHKAVGICGHCGKLSCAGKQSHSKLPATIPTSVVIKAMELARIEETPCKK